MADTPRFTRQSFPSRQYRYEFVIPPDVMMDAPSPGNVYRFVLGRDAMPVHVPKDEGRDTLHDPFAQHVLFGDGDPPLSLRTLLAKLDSAGITAQRSFVVADGGQIPWSAATEDLERNFRLAIVRQTPGDAQPNVLISASTEIDSEQNFLQVIGWDDKAGASQFYERRDGVWMWAGSGWDALAPDTRGRGPFDSHINGALNMKELKFPWLHWHSPSAAISNDVLAPGDPLRTEPVWVQRSLADDFERTVVRPGIQRWTDSRFARLTAGGVLKNLRDFFRQVLGTSTVNLASSPTSFAAMQGGADVRLPPTFAVDVDALLGTIGLDPVLAAPVVKATVYKSALERFAVRLKAKDHEFPQDTHFVFVVPEPAFEDLLVLEKLIDLRVLTARLAAAMLMVDFQNPVFSPRRIQLLQYVPDEAQIGAPAAFEATLVGAVRASPAAQTAGSAEQEFLANVDLGADAWRTEYEQRIEAFATALSALCGTPDGFAQTFQLAESRRREFRTRKLAEFRLTTPFTNIPETAPLLEFGRDGTVRPK
jgi:hypothetical protein